MKSLFSCTLVAALGLAWAADGPIRIEFFAVAPGVVQQRLQLATRKLSDRRAALESLFQEAGCKDDSRSEQPVRHSREPNVICTLPGETASEIVVGAHFDLADRGIGAVDDWSGAALLPSLYQSMADKRRRHRFVFVGFAAEEQGLLGSKEFVQRLPPEEKSRVRAMVNLECLGMSPPGVWASRADKTLLDAYVRTAGAMHVDPRFIDVDRVGDDDSHPFLNAGIPVLTIHSVTQETLRILHSAEDNLKAIHADDYYAAYRVAAAYLAYLDAALD